MLVFETLKNKKSDFLNSNMCYSARDYMVFILYEIHCNLCSLISWNNHSSLGCVPLFSVVHPLGNTLYLKVEFMDIVADKNIEFFIPSGMTAIFNPVRFQQSSRSYLTNNIGVGHIVNAISIWQVSGRLYMDLESSMEKWFIS